MTNQSLTFQYDIACTDCSSVWEAFASIVQELPVDDDTMIVSARHAGYAPNGCPVLEVEFGNMDIAKGFTAVYLGCADADDSDVDVYLGIYEDGGRLMTKQLSPAAQAVLNAFANKIADNPLNWLPRYALAAALRAAADLVVPVSDRPEPSNEFEYGQWLAKRTTRGYLLAIAAELEDAQ